ncbi:MAG: hypothetical protein K6T83_18160 [Alicyclobacillus sp.]|nr:hypothetical protein [Alicyclobacillus sp.]
MLFQIGKVHVTRPVLECSDIAVADLVDAFGRFIQGDWGDVNAQHHLLNDVALTGGRKVTARYKSQRGVEFWITNEANATTVLLPESAEGNVDIAG